MNIPVIYLGKTDKSDHVMVGAVCTEEDFSTSVNGLKAMVFVVKDEDGGSISYGLVRSNEKEWGHAGIRRKIRQAMINAAKRINERLVEFMEI